MRSWRCGADYGLSEFLRSPVIAKASPNSAAPCGESCSMHWLPRHEADQRLAAGSQKEDGNAIAGRSLDHGARRAETGARIGKRGAQPLVQILHTGDLGEAGEDVS